MGRGCGGVRKPHDQKGLTRSAGLKPGCSRLQKTVGESSRVGQDLGAEGQKPERVEAAEGMQKGTVARPTGKRPERGAHVRILGKSDRKCFFPIVVRNPINGQMILASIGFHTILRII